MKTEQSDPRPWQDPKYTASFEATARSPANTGLKRICAVLDLLLEEIDDWLDAGHSEDCDCAYCTRKYDTIKFCKAEYTADDLRGLRWAAHVAGGLISSVTCDERDERFEARLVDLQVGAIAAEVTNEPVDPPTLVTVNTLELKGC